MSGDDDVNNNLSLDIISATIEGRDGTRLLRKKSLLDNKSPQNYTGNVSYDKDCSSSTVKCVNSNRNSVEDMNEKSIDSSLADEMKSESKFRFGECEYDDIPYRLQGNLWYNTEENLMIRYNLKNHRGIRANMSKFWRLFNRRDAQHGLIRVDFVEFYVKMMKALYLPEHFNYSVAVRCAKRDWQRDVGSKVGMTKEQFFDSLFEVVDIWTDSLDAKDYIKFLNLLYERLTKLHGSSKSSNIWRTLNEVKCPTGKAYAVTIDVPDKTKTVGGAAELQALRWARRKEERRRRIERKQLLSATSNKSSNIFDKSLLSRPEKTILKLPEVNTNFNQNKLESKISKNKSKELILHTMDRNRIFFKHVTQALKHGSRINPNMLYQTGLDRHTMISPRHISTLLKDMDICTVDNDADNSISNHLLLDTNEVTKTEKKKTKEKFAKNFKSVVKSNKNDNNIMYTNMGNNEKINVQEDLNVHNKTGIKHKLKGNNASDLIPLSVRYDKKDVGNKKTKVVQTESNISRYGNEYKNMLKPMKNDRPSKSLTPQHQNVNDALKYWPTHEGTDEFIPIKFDNNANFQIENVKNRYHESDSCSNFKHGINNNSSNLDGVIVNNKNTDELNNVKNNDLNQFKHRHSSAFLKTGNIDCANSNAGQTTSSNVLNTNSEIYNDINNSLNDAIMINFNDNTKNNETNKYNDSKNKHYGSTNNHSDSMIKNYFDSTNNNSINNNNISNNNNNNNTHTNYSNNHNDNVNNHDNSANNNNHSTNNNNNDRNTYTNYTNYANYHNDDTNNNKNNHNNDNANNFNDSKKDDVMNINLNKFNQSFNDNLERRYSDSQQLGNNKSFDIPYLNVEKINRSIAIAHVKEKKAVPCLNTRNSYIRWMFRRQQQEKTKECKLELTPSSQPLINSILPHEFRGDLIDSLNLSPRATTKISIVDLVADKGKQRKKKKKKQVNDHVAKKERVNLSFQYPVHIT